MRKREFAIVFLVLLGVILNVQPAHAQDATSGAIGGMVKDRRTGERLAGVTVVVHSLAGNGDYTAITDGRGAFKVSGLPPGLYSAVFIFAEAKMKIASIQVSIGRSSQVYPQMDLSQIGETIVVKGRPNIDTTRTTQGIVINRSYIQYLPLPSGRNYKHIAEGQLHSVKSRALSTFSLDVDTASYSNVRRFLKEGQRPPSDAVKIEELINYFGYEDRAPQGASPLAVYSEVAPAPWNRARSLVRIGIKSVEIPAKALPASNLVFLIDVSGSMSGPDRLDLLKNAFRLLVSNLRPQDRVAIVVYAGAAGVVLPSTPGSQRWKILEALDALEAGGSTAGGAGIQLAYELAQKHFIKDGNNRVILATDGDFNVGTSSEEALIRLIEGKRKSGVFLTVLGFGRGNYQDSKMEQLADKGNGNHAYIDNLLEAKKVLVKEMGATLVTVASDVKIQVEFNPRLVRSYRLIGYENRMLADKDFNDDKKDAGELGAGHSVSALYELVYVKQASAPGIDRLKYQESRLTSAGASAELMTIKLRYKPNGSSKSRRITHSVFRPKNPRQRASRSWRWAAAVAEFGMLLRNSKHKGKSSYKQVLSLAKGALGQDTDGYRSEFVSLVEKASALR
ncbi:MAG: von Willebrand factor type A domain-containing protein [Kofleriaceae bacterium]|nr:von Willebrand factor type A domain-containing protein [Kofleriaceae bacterium]